MSFFKKLSIFGIGLYLVWFLVWIIGDQLFWLMLLWVSSITFTICFVVYNIYFYMKRKKYRGQESSE